MTKFSVGLWDSLFGKRAAIELPSAGGTVRRDVTEKWLQSREAAGKIARVQPDERARRLVTVIRLAVTSSEVSLADSDATLHWVLNRLEAWRLCLTAATIGMAVTQERTSPGMVETVDRLLAEQDPALREAVADFLSFMFKREERIPKDLIPATVGLWVLRNVKGTPEPPEGGEIDAAPRVGHFCIRMGAIWETAPI
jgi:hypothetical protein